jgi:hypothetical protein
LKIGGLLTLCLAFPDPRRRERYDYADNAYDRYDAKGSRHRRNGEAQGSDGKQIKRGHLQVVEAGETQVRELETRPWKKTSFFFWLFDRGERGSRTSFMNHVIHHSFAHHERGGQRIETDLLLDAIIDGRPTIESAILVATASFM